MKKDEKANMKEKKVKKRKNKKRNRIGKKN